MAARPPTTKRTTTTSTSLPAAGPPCTIDPTAIIADKAQLTGSHPVTIAEHVVLHPYARIRAEGGSVTIGPYCIVSEGAVVGLPEGEMKPIATAFPSIIVAKALNIVGVAVGDRRDAIETLAFAERGVVKTHFRTAKMEELTAVFEELESQKLQGRVVLDLR